MRKFYIAVLMAVCTVTCFGCNQSDNGAKTAKASGDKADSFKLQTGTSPDERVEADYLADEYDLSDFYIDMESENCGYALCCSSPAAGYMHKVIYYTEDSFDSFEKIDISDSVTAYPTGILDAGDGKCYITTQSRNGDDYLFYTDDYGTSWEKATIDDITIGVDAYVEECDENTILLLDKNNENERVYTAYAIEDDGTFVKTDTYTVK